MKWETPQQMKDLLNDLVKIPSITGSEQEVRFGHEVYGMLQELPYFREFPEQLKLHATNDNRNILSALVKKEGCRDTVILLSHFDVVAIEDYGAWKDLAFNPDELTASFYTESRQFPEEIQKDLKSGEWLFGRGTMDMKCGLALHMSLLEKAAAGHFNGNVLLLTVCDEEANSVGMRTAIPIVNELTKQYKLNYRLCINSEPMFSSYPGDENKYIYSGSLGKLLPGFYCMGKETHVGEPFEGLNSNYLTSMITCDMELNTDFCENVDGERTPPPTNLLQKDLKKEYSVQIPDRSVTLFNLYLIKKSLSQVQNELMGIAEKAARKIEKKVTKQREIFSYQQSKGMDIQVLSFESLLEYAEEKLGQEKINELFAWVLSNPNRGDDREQTISLIDTLALYCKELAPMIVPFIAPPFYPPVNSSEDTKEWIPELIQYARKTHNLDLKHQNFFPGLCDLSYVTASPIQDIQEITSNMPLWNKGYYIPMDILAEMHIPVINIGPYGKDAHKMTERLHLHYAFKYTKEMLEWMVTKVFES
ncbi:M20/M25/M40 family metallo-hydrolase [Neobacillus terrae]|uniref:M20/M25/M40 family metallo-hydrolase n=1 Tax=Neobacillus terrae TaxID=3034837 RepID=UPI0014072D33|nr:M20/M25/M40 family metallo-hydrolase [Neobacillus terrae]NHM31909.1 M20/M25/M40 family metallo-hydrolase [Neobacillus terrae]